MPRIATGPPEADSPARLWHAGLSRLQRHSNAIPCTQFAENHAWSRFSLNALRSDHTSWLFVEKRGFSAHFGPDGAVSPLALYLLQN